MSYRVGALIVLVIVLALYSQWQSNREMSAMVGRPVPAAVLRLYDSNAPRATDVPIASFKGKVVLLDFWASWCGPCRRTVPEIQALHARFAHQGLRTFGVSVEASGGEQDRRELGAHVSLGAGYPMAADIDGTLQRFFNVRVIPTVVLVDKSGVVRFVGSVQEVSDLEGEIAKLL